MQRTSARERIVAEAREDPFHPDIISYLDAFPTSVAEMPSLIISGPQAAGKRTLGLVVVAGFSPSAMRYEKKLYIGEAPRRQEDVPCMPMSDIHFEVDMSLPCFGNKAGWASAHKAIVDAVEIRRHKYAFVMCTHFHLADRDLIRGFSNFMDSGVDGVNLRYILVTEHYSRLPLEIRQMAHRIAVPVPPRTPARAPQCLEESSASAALDAVCSCSGVAAVPALRHAIYAGLTRNMDVSRWAWHLFRRWKERGGGAGSPCKDLMALDALIVFHEKCARSYRPIFHLERLALFLGTLIDGQSSGDASPECTGTSAAPGRAARIPEGGAEASPRQRR